jgi:hypothetical protein
MDTSSLTPQKHYHQGIFPTVLLQPSFLRVAGRSRAYPLPQLTFPGDELEGGAIARPGFSGSAINGKTQRRQITLNSAPAAFVCPLP